MRVRKKPVEVEAVQWSGKNMPEIAAFIGGGELSEGFTDDNLEIKTLEGTMKASIGDWIIKGVSGEFYPCKPDIFDKTYDIIDG